MFKEIKKAKLIKINTKISPSILLANNDPIIDPDIIPATHFCTTFLSTLSNFICESTDEIEVNIIIQREEATDTCITTSIEYPNCNKIKYETGTMIIPPPTPNNPAIRPEKRPVNKNVTIKIIN